MLEFLRGFTARLVLHSGRPDMVLSLVCLKKLAPQNDVNNLSVGITHSLSRSRYVATLFGINVKPYLEAHTLNPTP